MYKLKIENEAGEQLELTNSAKYDVVEVTGLTSPDATINTSNVVGVDGSYFNSSRIGKRNIVITLNIKHPIEENRIYLYNFFRVKKSIKVYYQNEHRKVYTSGYIESFENNIFTELQQPQISIICPSPFWNAMSETNATFSKETPLFEFPFSIAEEGIEFSRIDSEIPSYVNVGDVETGGIIKLSANAEVVNPIFYNLTSNEYFKLDYTMQKSDVITIDTIQGEKSVTLLRDGKNINILPSMGSGSSWIIFQPGENHLSYGADSGDTDLIVSVAFAKKYIGV